MKKQIVLSIALACSIYGIYKFFESPEKFILKKTKKIIKLSSLNKEKNKIALISKITKYIKYDAKFTANYEGQIYQAQSLNQIRSLIMWYLKEGSTVVLNYEKLQAHFLDSKKIQAFFLIIFRKNKKVFSCEVSLDWLKKEKWLIKKVEIKNCRVKKQ
ncbi:MAG: hypothetical protein GDA46_00420 [Bdellovibrionales bacterium]|nr:hypothetical protein [Bdellovibrionales bacterium]